MTMNEALKKKVDIVIAFCRIGGGMSAIIGTLILVFFVLAALDPNASITINGVATTDQNAKNFAVLFCAFFPLLGLFLAVVPEKHLVKWVIIIVKLFS